MSTHKQPFQAAASDGLLLSGTAPVGGTSPGALALRLHLPVTLWRFNVAGAAGGGSEGLEGSGRPRGAPVRLCRTWIGMVRSRWIRGQGVGGLAGAPRNAPVSLARRADALGLPRDLAVEPGSQQPEPLRKGPRWGPEPTRLTVRRTRRLLCAPSDRAGQVLQQQTAFGLKAILNFLQAIVNFFIFFFKTIMNPSAAVDVSG